MQILNYDNNQKNNNTFFLDVPKIKLKKPKNLMDITNYKSNEKMYICCFSYYNCIII